MRSSKKGTTMKNSIKRILEILDRQEDEITNIIARIDELLATTVDADARNLLLAAKGEIAEERELIVAEIVFVKADVEIEKL